VSGYDDLNRVAADLTKAAARAQYRAPLVVAKAAHDVEAISKSFCPVDTGFLRSSIGVDLDLFSVRAVVGPTAEYGPYVEFGTSRQAPAAFMGPALDRVAPGFVQAIEALGGDVL
jgi:HK97 gp10 family phage protein